MMNFLRAYKVHVLIGLLAVFLLSIAFSFGSSFFVKGSPNDTIVEVDGRDIPVRKYWSHYYRSVDPNKPMDAAAQAQHRDETIRDLVQSDIFAREVKRYGIGVPDQQVAISLTQFPAFQTQGKFDPQRYVQTLQSQLRTTPKEFEEEQRMSIGFFKLRWMIQSVIKVTDKELEMSEGYAEFAKSNQFEDANGKKRKRTDAEIRDLFRSRLWNDKVMFSFNTWLMGIGQNLKVTPHLDVLEGRSQG